MVLEGDFLLSLLLSLLSSSSVLLFELSFFLGETFSRIDNVVAVVGDSNLLATFSYFLFVTSNSSDLFPRISHHGSLLGIISICDASSARRSIFLACVSRCKRDVTTAEGEEGGGGGDGEMAIEEEEAGVEGSGEAGCEMVWDMSASFEAVENASVDIVD